MDFSTFSLLFRVFTSWIELFGLQFWSIEVEVEVEVEEEVEVVPIEVEVVFD